ncbi:unnamed protein product [Albugo candida]|uniref:Uncharacterized protein n=1 Tax=Albugo candida TaxID=65357 RepID=A0A024FZ32_9STRA|nr:unnamed protein product [Albugo candida]|eukprot:CCI39677.1 unnamed protein product [Albugo candida]
MRIPFIIHQIWLGPHPIPAFCLQQMKTWQQIHPKWDYKLWTDNELSTLKLRNENRFNLAANFGEKSDILRYEILLQFGGLYVDVDFKCLKSFEGLCKVRSIHSHYPFVDLTRVETFSFVTGISNTSVFELNNGLLACTQHHPIMKELVDTLATQNPAMALTDARILGNIADFTTGKLFMRQSTEFMQTINQTGPGLLTKTFMRAIGWKSGNKIIPGFLPRSESDNVIALPSEYFYPIPNHLSHQKMLDFKLPVEAMAVHYWSRTWQTNSLRG